ncbi:MAG: hypothetical protein M1817_004312 [Caeruleum heppii]|nr:MAG: hypothetical protein M1817_004312 [Caeruleum heppii]
MKASSLKPKLLSKEPLLQRSYELPHRAHTAKVYPVPSPNGSSILIYGHSQGIRFLWRGGKPFKRTVPKPDKPKGAANGVAKDVVMIIDSDEDEPDTPITDEAIFEDDEEEPTGQDGSFPSIVQTLDLPLGTEVLHISTPNIKPDAQRAYSFVPPIVSQRLVIAVACSDDSVRVVTLPLLPPSPALKDRIGSEGPMISSDDRLGPWREQVCLLGGHNTHLDIPTAVSLTFNPRYASTDPDADSEGNRQSSRIQSDWDLLVASHTPEGSGVLRIFRAPLIQQSRGSRIEYLLSIESVKVPQTQSLSSPAVTISFNTAPLPARRHSRLLVAESSGVVRIFDCSPSTSKIPRAHGSRRSSGLAPPETDQGLWLISLYPGFAPPANEDARIRGSSSGRISHRKRIVDAKWVSAGKGIMVLLSDGEWGVWEMEGTNALESGRDLANALGERFLHGAAFTTWSYGGWLGQAVRDKTDNSASFAPKTPRSRQRGERNLFKGPTIDNHTYTQGGLAIQGISDDVSRSFNDEAILIWYQDSLTIIPSLRTYQQIHLKGGALYGSGGRGGIMELEGLQLRGQRIYDVDLLPPTRADRKAIMSGDLQLSQMAHSQMKPQLEVLVTEDSRLLSVSPWLPRSRGSLGLEHAARSESHGPLGDLDINGIDQALDRLTGSNGQQRSITATKRKVGFVDSR